MTIAIAPMASYRDVAKCAKKVDLIFRSPYRAVTGDVEVEVEVEIQILNLKLVVGSMAGA